MWRKADAVCFDVDSTVCLDEGIDELAEFCGAGNAVAEWTARFNAHATFRSKSLIDSFLSEFSSVDCLYSSILALPGQ